MMPELGGVEASREIRSISSAPILFLTAKSQERDMLQAYQSGGDDYLVKPFSSAELLMRVESLLRRYRVYKGKINGKILRQDIVLDEENRPRPARRRGRRADGDGVFHFTVSRRAEGQGRLRERHLRKRLA